MNIFYSFHSGHILTKKQNFALTKHKNYSPNRIQVTFHTNVLTWLSSWELSVSTEKHQRCGQASYLFVTLTCAATSFRRWVWNVLLVLCSCLQQNKYNSNIAAPLIGRKDYEIGCWVTKPIFSFFPTLIMGVLNPNPYWKTVQGHVCLQRGLLTLSGPAL
jgi:hypothetical protein